MEGFAGVLHHLLRQEDRDGEEEEMSDVVIVLPREKFKSLKGKDIRALIERNLPKVEETLRAEREEFLREKIGKLEEKLREMEGQLNELREFYKKALRDKELMMAERDKLRKENEELRKRLDEKRSSGIVNDSFTERERR
ncbi:Conserved hypothetical protein [Thermococcus gammatolerans EJ3]|uniref:Uncharacterized protein n=2 Tax=Thermococcus TaxID=2263 RepID=C5A631_THEGJ|nr:Conserved hypothetical protein [Thermococcus gammatolerans EJ3]